jgi:hypothetical protein
MKKNIWMKQPTSDLATIDYKRGEKKRKDMREHENEEENCAKDQELAQNHGYCCHQHAKVAKTEHEKYKKQVNRQKEKTKGVVLDEPEQCIHYAEDPCVFNQIEMRLCKNNEIYYDIGDYEKAPITYNSSRRKRAFQYAAFILWEGVNYRKPHSRCVEDGVRALFPPLDGKIMGYKEK